MFLIDFLTPDLVRAGVLVHSKKRALEYIAELLARSAGVSVDDVMCALCTRERLGTTALGGGVAVPHGRIRELETVTGALIRLEQAVDFHAADGQPVDLLFVLLVPAHVNEDHLMLLAQIAEMLSEPSFVDQLRSAADSDALYELISNWHAQAA